MKKIIVFIFIIFISSFSVFAKKDFPILKDVPSGFKAECYDLHTNIDSSFFQKGITTYLNSNKADIIVIQNNKILPIKLLSQKDGFFYPYAILNGDNIENNFDYRTLKDGNKKTFLELTLGKDKLLGEEIILEFTEEVREYSSIFNFSYESKFYIPEFYISEDGIKYIKVSRNDITDFSFKYLKIDFATKYKSELGVDGFVEKIKINELFFIKNINTFALISFFDSPIDVYSSYSCKGTFNIYPNSFSDFGINSTTKTVDAYLSKNSKKDVYIKKDIDFDKIEDYLDNCKIIYNPRQLDSNSDGKGDLCSDDDNDGIIGIEDNCKYISNPDQKDINRNGVGDKCEFDKDKDGFFDSLDNCINIFNSDQEDKDKDSIGDMCDNSIYYNPMQIDKNNNGIGDITEEKEKYLLENDKDKDKILDNIDNCKNIANFDQEDIDKDGIGNSCDNCKNIQNTNQLDFNENGVGDMCEDSDNDGLDGLIDNCINIPNPEQKDSDNNGIGDLCEDKDGDKKIFAEDNCPYKYNPDQKDTDKDNIGDICDEEDNRYIESNKNFFIGFMVFITIMFFAGISIMLKKLGNKEKI